MVERGLALRILGLTEGVDEVDLQSAYVALRGHIEARAAVSETPALRFDRLAELRDLERAYRTLTTVPVPAGFSGVSGAVRTPRVGGIRPLVLTWAIVATLVAVGLGAYVWNLQGDSGPLVLTSGLGGGSGSDGLGGYALDGDELGGLDGGGSGNSAEAKSAGDRAQLVTRTGVEGAMLQIRTRGENAQLVAEGAADETVYWLAPGEYALRVAHPDCPDDWTRDLAVRGGEHHHFAPRVCQQTGWVTVRSNVSGDELSIDGKKLGPTGPKQHPVAAGEHEVRVEKLGHEPWEGVVEVEAGQVHGIRPRLSAMAAKKPRAKRPRQEEVQRLARRTSSQQTRPGSAVERDRDNEGWHEQATQWLLARYDTDRSELIDSPAELEAISCDMWAGLEKSHDQAGLGLSLTKFYGFNGEGWVPNALGIGAQVRDLAYQRMMDCGLQ